jgi:ABC-type lipoprotein export system ATPase subunit
MSLTITLRNYKSHVNRTVTIQLGSLTQLFGPSGSGKSSLMLGMYWILYAKERGVGHFDQKKDERTFGSLACEDWVVERMNRPDNLKVVHAGVTYEGPPAEDWIAERFGPPLLWRMACLQRLKGENTIMSGNQSDKVQIMREISFQHLDVGKFVERATEYLKLKQADLKLLQDKCAAIDSVHKENPVPELADLDEAAVEADMATQAALIAEHGTAEATLTALSAAYSEAKGIIEANATITANTKRLTDEEQQVFSKSDPVAEWLQLQGELKTYTEALRRVLLMGTQLKVLRDEREQILKDHEGLREDTPVVSLKEWDKIEQGHAAVDQVARKLGLPLGTSLTQAAWEQTADDVRLWRMVRGDVEQWFADRERHQVKGGEIRAEGAEVGLPQEYAGMEVHTALVWANVVQAKLHDTQVTFDAEDLVASIRERLAAVAELLRADDQAKRWAEVETSFRALSQKDAQNVSPETIKRVQEAIYEAELDIKICPSCDAELILSQGEFRLHRNRVPRTQTVEELRTELATLQAQKTAYDEVVQLNRRVVEMELDPAFRAQKPLDPTVLGALNRESFVLRDLEKRSHPNHPRAFREWLARYGERYVKLQTAHREHEAALITHAAQGERLAKRLCLKDGLGASVSETFLFWWTKDAQRGMAGPELRVAVEATTRLPPFVAANTCPREHVASITRLREITQDLVARERLVDQANAEIAVPDLFIPEYPALDHIDCITGDNLRDMAGLNTAAEEIKNLLTFLRDRQQLFILWKTNEEQVQKAEAARDALGTLEPQLERARAAKAAHQTAERRLHMLRLYLPWRQRQTTLTALERDREVAAGDVLLAKQLLERLHLKEAQCLEQSMQIYADNVNEIIVPFFEEPTYVELSGFKTNKGNKQTKVCLNVVIVIGGHPYSDLSSLSDGEQSRLALALSIAAAKLHRFPLYVVDESLSTMQPELRGVVLRTLREHLGHKAVVAVIHDDAIGTFDDVIDLTT